MSTDAALSATLILAFVALRMWVWRIGVRFGTAQANLLNATLNQSARYVADAAARANTLSAGFSHAAAEMSERAEAVLAATRSYTIDLRLGSLSSMRRDGDNERSVVETA